MKWNCIQVYKWQSFKIKEIVLNNGIKTRYYALTKGKATIQCTDDGLGCEVFIRRRADKLKAWCCHVELLRPIK
jgi:hypothetical protein